MTLTEAILTDTFKDVYFTAEDSKEYIIKSIECSTCGETVTAQEGWICWTCGEENFDNCC